MFDSAFRNENESRTNKDQVKNKNRSSRLNACNLYAHQPASSRRTSASSIAMPGRSEEHTSELQSLMRISYAVFCLKKKNNKSATSDNENADQQNKQHTE